MALVLPVTLVQGTTANAPDVMADFNAVADYINSVLGPALIPSGSRTIWLQPSAPTGWTQDNTFNDRVLRLINNTGTGANTGGSWTITGLANSGTAITQAQLPNVNFTVVDPAHTHGYFDPTHQHNGQYATRVVNGGSDFTTLDIDTFSGNPVTAFAGIGITIANAVTGIVVNSAGGNATHTHTISSDASWRPAFANGLVATKD